CLVAMAGCSEPQPGTILDEAMRGGRTAASFPAADEDFFADMDGGYNREMLNANAVRGRNTWIVWTFGNDRFWDYMANHTFGAFDLLKIVSSPPDFGYCTDDASPDHRINYDSPTNALSHDSCVGPGKFWVTISRDNRWK